MFIKYSITRGAQETLAFYSNVFLVCKASGGWRLVTNLKNLNFYINGLHFHIFTMASQYVKKWRFCLQLDLEDAYFHISIHPSSRKYLRLTLQGKAHVYQLKVQPFVLNTGPQVFTRLGHTVAAYLSCLGISVFPFYDDYLVHHPD